MTRLCIYGLMALYKCCYYYYYYYYYNYYYYYYYDGSLSVTVSHNDEVDNVLTCVHLSGRVSDSVSHDLNTESVIARHAVDAYVWRVALADVHRRRASSSLVVGGRHAADDDRQYDHQVPTTTT